VKLRKTAKPVPNFLLPVSLFSSLEINKINKNGTLFSRVPFVIKAMKGGAYCTDVRELLILLNTLPMTGPRINKTAITTTATKTRINAYSTRPWPFSFGANNIVFHLLSVRISLIANSEILALYTFSITDTRIIHYSNLTVIFNLQSRKIGKKRYSVAQSTICHQSDERGCLLHRCERVVNLAEYVADDWAEDQQNSNYDDSNQNKD
jgi:hypothetical protein